ncbi:TauD/TfdA family dioxygenase [Bradyrhizobium sp. BEA-2-5]|uniref:TauD/TfdA dioxygenase family protein n=1 Tax=Bradyrhizobium sp. BEA-2-5 TaxID=3080015 RepID=UPI00293E71B1|nr:TauD/TfdA family dioxygenase [Bradyrhizobium sp. BEA-2-5]WOH80464.1 TauD/TfdA family dioxygenase [Bradyrhizobium sp. BEA-2-5]
MSNAMTVGNVIPRADIVRHAVRLGAEVKNIRLSDDLSDEVIAAINRLLLEHKVIFFRDQGHLDDAQQRRFAVRLGSLIPHPAMVDEKDGSTIREAPSDRACRHVDKISIDDDFRAGGPKISVLRGAAIPPFGGDIVWSNTAAAYLDLPDPLRMFADNLWAVHEAAFDCTVRAGATQANKKRMNDVAAGTIYETTQPVVRVHPETGERMLSLSHSVKNFVGLQRYPSQKLFELLQSYLTAPENTVCWNWKSGDVVIWDNRATDCYPVNKAGVHYRGMGRLTVDGGLPPVKKLKSRADQAA